MYNTFTNNEYPVIININKEGHMNDCIIGLRDKNLKVTPQRLAIYKYLLGTTSHPTAQEIYSEIKIQFPSISFATVYKTLNILRDANLVLEFNVGGDCFRYDANVAPHPHFICRCCEQVSDLEVPSSVSLIGEFLADANKGYVIEHTDMYLYGICRDCN